MRTPDEVETALDAGDRLIHERAREKERKHLRLITTEMIEKMIQKKVEEMLSKYMSSVQTHVESQMIKVRVRDASFKVWKNLMEKVEQEARRRVKKILENNEMKILEFEFKFGAPAGI